MHGIDWVVFAGSRPIIPLAWQTRSAWRSATKLGSGQCNRKFVYKFIAESLLKGDLIIYVSI